MEALLRQGLFLTWKVAFYATLCCRAKHLLARICAWVPVSSNMSNTTRPRYLHHCWCHSKYPAVATPKCVSMQLSLPLAQLLHCDQIDCDNVYPQIPVHTHRPRQGMHNQRLADKLAV